MDEKVIDAIWRASDLICRKRYFEARLVLTGIDDPVAKEWVYLLDQKIAKRTARNLYSITVSHTA